LLQTPKFLISLDFSKSIDASVRRKVTMLKQEKQHQNSKNFSKKKLLVRETTSELRKSMS